MRRIMSSWFWIACGAVVIGSAVAGITLGNYASGNAEGGIWSDRASAHAAGTEDGSSYLFDGLANRSSSAPAPVAEVQSEPLVCQGCGPTLAERQMMSGFGAFAPDGVTPDPNSYEEQEGAVAMAPARQPAPVPKPVPVPKAALRSAEALQATIPARPPHALE